MNVAVMPLGSYVTSPETGPAEVESRKVAALMVEASMGSENTALTSAIRLTVVAPATGAFTTRVGGLATVNDHASAANGSPSTVLTPLVTFTVYVAPVVSDADGAKRARPFEKLRVPAIGPPGPVTENVVEVRVSGSIGSADANEISASCAPTDAFAAGDGVTGTGWARVTNDSVL